MHRRCIRVRGISASPIRGESPHPKPRGPVIGRAFARPVGPVRPLRKRERLRRRISERCVRSQWRWLRRRRCTMPRRRVSDYGLRARAAASRSAARRWRRSGWPSAQAPPLMLSFSRGMPRSRCAAIAHHREGFVDLEQVDIANAPADLVEQLADRRDRRGGEPLRFLAVGGVALDLGQRGQAVAVGQRAPRQDQRRGAIGIGRGGGRRDGAARAERRLQAGNFGGIDFQRMLVVCDGPERRLFPSRRSARSRP